MDGAGAVEELDGIGGFGEGVAGDEGEEGNGLAGAGRHFEKGVAFGIESTFQLHHVRVLLWVDVVVGEIHCHIFDLEFHSRRRQTQRWRYSVEDGGRPRMTFLPLLLTVTR